MSAAPRTETPYSAAIDAQQYPTNTVVSGTAGTSDVNGTAEVIRLGGNPTTGGLYTEIIAGTFNAGTFTSVSRGSVSTGNTTVSPLGINGSFVGAWEDIKDYGIVYVGVRSDTPSATNGFYIEFSNDGTTSRGSTDVYDIAANSLKEFAFNPGMRYIRTTYINNSGTAQTSFQLQTIYKNIGLPSSHKISENVTDNTDAQMVKSITTGRTSAGTYLNIQASSDGRLFVTNDALYSEDTPHISGGTGIFVMGVRNDAGTAFTNANGDYSPFRVDGTGNIYTGGGTVNSVAIHNGTLGTAGTASDGAQGTLRLDQNEALWVNLGYKLDSTNDSITALMSSGTLTTGTLNLLNNLTNGTVRISVGTIVAGTLNNLATGTINALAAGTMQTSYPSFNFISTAGTTTIKSSAGILHVINIGLLTGAGTLYNSVGTSSSVIWNAPAVTTPQSFPFDLAFGSLTWAGTGSENITFIYA